MKILTLLSLLVLMSVVIPANRAQAAIFQPISHGYIEIDFTYSYSAPVAPFMVQSISTIKYRVMGDGFVFAQGTTTVNSGIFGVVQALQPIHMAINNACAQMRNKYRQVNMLTKIIQMRMPYAPDSQTTQTGKCP